MAVLTTTTVKRNAWIKWLDKCRGGIFVNQLFFGKTIGGVPEPWVEAVQALETVLRATGYTPKSAWAYNFRGISGAPCSCSRYGSCSLHGNGIAVDIDPSINPYKRTTVFRWSDTAFTPTQIAAVEAIRNTRDEQLWFWGGRWRSIKDYMHFEANVDPGSARVDWSTVKGGGDMEIVAHIQKALIEAGYDLGDFPPFADGFPPGADGDWGAKTQTAFVAALKSGSGSAGPQGPRGRPGPRGSKGDKGDRGPEGPGGSLTIRGAKEL